MTMDYDYPTNRIHHFKETQIVVIQTIGYDTYDAWYSFLLMNNFNL